MLRWLRGKKESGELPQYSRLKSITSYGLPAELQEKEGSASFQARRDMVERDLLEPGNRPPDDVPLFIELLVGDGGVVTIPIPNSNRHCLPVFSTPARAGDYVRTLLASGAPEQYLSTSPLQLLGMLHDLKGAGVDVFTVDRCPRCSIFGTTASNSMKAPADLVTVWAIAKATELARAELYSSHAVELALSGRFEAARDVALESVGHVSMEDPRFHLLLGQLAIGLGDRKLLREAKAFLRFFSMINWERKLDEVERSGSPDFTEPE